MRWRCPAYHTTNLLIKELSPVFWLMLMLRTDFKSLQNEVSREMEAVAELPGTFEMLFSIPSWPSSRTKGSAGPHRHGEKGVPPFLRPIRVVKGQV